MAHQEGRRQNLHDLLKMVSGTTYINRKQRIFGVPGRNGIAPKYWFPPLSSHPQADSPKPDSDLSPQGQSITSDCCISIKTVPSSAFTVR